ncbi:MAG: hypothetical protein JNM43_24965 [Planctomycetaceae bacterium]|nr:hypothetical protein [Planctomycetaceae bacterium]
MKKFLGLIVYAVVMFGVTAGLGMFMLKKSAPHATESAHGEEKGTEGEHEPAEDGHSSEVASSDHETSTHESDVASHGDGDHAPGAHEPKRTAAVDEQLPVAVRATPMSVEEIVRMGLSLKSRDETVRKREAALKEMESQQKLAAADILTAQQEIENLLAQATEQRKATEELLARIKDQDKTLTNEREAIAAERQKLNEDLAKLETDKKAIAAKEASLKSTEDDLAMKRKTLDSTQASLNQQEEDFVKRLEKHGKEKNEIDEQKRQNELEKDRLANLAKTLEVERKNQEANGIAGATVPSNKVDVTQTEEFKKTTDLISGLDPTRAATILSNLAKEENLEYVLDVLTALDDKNAVKIIDAIQDDQLASDLLLQLSKRNQALKAANK